MVFLSIPGSLKGPVPALCICPMGNEAGCQGFCPGPHRDTVGVVCSLELMTSLNAQGLAEFPGFRSSSTLSYRICRVGMLVGEWEAMLKCESETGWDTGRWAV